MVTTTVMLETECGQGWKAKHGILGGPGPLASVHFRHRSGASSIAVGIDLDKEILLSEIPFDIERSTMRVIVERMNLRRRRLMADALFPEKISE